LDELAGEGPAPHARLADQEGHGVVGLLDRLNRREATVLRLRFGLGGDGPRTSKEVGRRMGLSGERVRQIEREGLGKLGRWLGSGAPTRVSGGRWASGPGGVPVLVRGPGAPPRRTARATPLAYRLLWTLRGRPSLGAGLGTDGPATTRLHPNPPGRLTAPRGG